MGHNITGFLWVNHRVRGVYATWSCVATSATNIKKGLEIKAMIELQPGVSQSCCREDRHRNNQVDIKSKEYNRVSMGTYILQS